jgi:hypothetical protein
MKHNIIKTENYLLENYLLVVDDSEIKEGDWIYEFDSNSVNIAGKGYHNFTQSDAKITAHLPLNNSPVLEGVPLLPPLENEVEEVWEQGLEAELKKLPYTKHLDDGQYNDGQLVGFEFGATWGYNKAKEKYKYTEEDLRKAIRMCKGEFTIEEIIQSLQQPKMPVAFECEKIYCGYIEDEALMKTKTTTNPQGQTEWVGKYIY